MGPPEYGLNFHVSLKKRVAPPPPPPGNGATGIVTAHYGTLPSSVTLAGSSHSRTTSEPILAGNTLHSLPHSLNTLNSMHHKRSPSGDSSISHGTCFLQFLNFFHLLYSNGFVFLY